MHEKAASTAADPMIAGPPLPGRSTPPVAKKSKSGKETLVLHVVDRVTGGVPVAVATYVRNSPSGARHVVISPFVDGEPAQIWSEVPTEHADLGQSHSVRIVNVRRAIRRFKPSVVHAHSSFAGVYARLSMSKGRVPLVYSPHCFAFERRDIRRGAQIAYRAAETILGVNTTVLAACGPGEGIIADGLRTLRGRVAVVPNVASLPEISRPSRVVLSQWKIGMAGRLSAQKDPAYFLEVIDTLRAGFPELRSVWCGDGAQDEMDRLRGRGVKVTGWLSPAELSRELDGLQVYLHSAAWEGFPIAILDAHARGLPILARRISALADLPDELSIEHGIAGLMKVLGDQARFNAWRDINISAWSEYLGSFNSFTQRASLARIWGM